MKPEDIETIPCVCCIPPPEVELINAKGEVLGSIIFHHVVRFRAGDGGELQVIPNWTATKQWLGGMGYSGPLDFNEAGVEVEKG